MGLAKTHRRLQHWIAHRRRTTALTLYSSSPGFTVITPAIVATMPNFVQVALCSSD